MKIFIYELLNKDGLPIYIGSTKNIKERIYTHKKRFFKKYGTNFSSHKIILECEESKRFTKEQCYHDLCKFLDMPIVGIRSGYKHSDSTKKLISFSNIGKKASPEARLKMAISQKGRVVSKETRELISKNSKRSFNRSPNPLMMAAKEANRKRMICVSDQFGNTYESIRDCERRTGCRRVSISMVLDGKIEKYKGYIFRRTNESK